LIIYITKSASGDWKRWYLRIDDVEHVIWEGHSWNPEWIMQELIALVTRLNIVVPLHTITFDVYEEPYED
jgi:hypothetical protein